MPILPIDQGGTGADTAAGARTNLGFPATANRYLRNDGSGVPAALGATETANLDAVAGAAPKPTFSTKTAAAAYNPGTVQGDVFLTGSSFSGSVGRAELFVDAGTGSDPTDLPAPAFVRLADGRLKRWSGRTFPLELGAKGDNSTDNSNFFEDVSGSMTGFTGVYELDRGLYKTNKTLKIAKAASLIGQDSRRTIITAAGSIGTFTDQAVLAKIGPTPTQIANLSASANRGDRLLNFATPHGLLLGERGLIVDPRDYSYGGDPVAGTGLRPNYKAGEYFQVLEVLSTTQVRTVGAIMSDTGYDHAHVDVYKLDMAATGSLEGIGVIAPGAGVNGAVQAIHVGWMRDIVLCELAAGGSDHCSLSLHHIFGGVAAGIRSLQVGLGAFGTSYGATVSGCQDFDIAQSYLQGHRHAITIGGGNGVFELVDRNVRIHHSHARSAAFTAIDFHGPAEYCSYDHMHVSGHSGLTLAGNHNWATDIQFDVDSHALYGGELTGANHLIRGWRGRSALNTGYGVFDIGTDGGGLIAGTRKGKLKFYDLECSAPAAANGLVHVRNRGMTADLQVETRNISYDAPVAANAGTIAVFGVTGSAVSRIVASNIDGPATLPNVYVADTDAATPVIGLSEAGRVSGTTSTSAAVLDLTVTFRRPFPRAPSVTTTVHSHTTGGAGDRLDAQALSVTTSGFTFRFIRQDDPLGNFTGAIVVTGSWSASSV